MNEIEITVWIRNGLLVQVTEFEAARRRGEEERLGIVWLYKDQYFSRAIRRDIASGASEQRRRTWISERHTGAELGLGRCQ